jgi:hypothetical protein
MATSQMPLMNMAVKAATDRYAYSFELLNRRIDTQFPGITSCGMKHRTFGEGTAFPIRRSTS